MSADSRREGGRRASVASRDEGKRRASGPDRGRIRWRIRRGLATLRWQLTLSHLIAIAVTLISMIAALVLLSSAWIAAQNTPAREPAQDARIVARAVGNLVVRGEHARLAEILRAVVANDVRLLVGPGPNAPEVAQRNDAFNAGLRNLAYVVVLAPDGGVLATSGPADASFGASEREAWATLARAALGRDPDTDDLTIVRPGASPAALGAYPVLGAGGEVRGVVVVAKTELPPPSRVGNVLRAFFFFTAATVGVLAGSFLFAFASASLVGYLLARGLVARLERLGAASEAIAGGDLARRVEEGPGDEVGQLARRFNRMADRLAATVTDLDGERRQAEEALRAKRELIANVSHELRTPLASIRAHAESLLMRSGEADVRQRTEALGIVHRETEHLGRLIDDLFMLSTAEAGALRLTIRDVDVGEVVDGVVQGFEPLARQGRVSLLHAPAPALPPVRADRERLVQLLGNLVRNALRFTLEGGLVSLRAEQAGDAVRVTVEDTGLGIPPDRLPHLFERFYRGDEARDRPSGGAGLGLAIVRELVEAMGGTIGVDSVVGEGSRFWFTLPVASSPVASSPDGDPATHGVTSV